MSKNQFNISPNSDFLSKKTEEKMDFGGQIAVDTLELTIESSTISNKHEYCLWWQTHAIFFLSLVEKFCLSFSLWWHLYDSLML